MATYTFCMYGFIHSTCLVFVHEGGGYRGEGMGEGLSGRLTISLLNNFFVRPTLTTKFRNLHPLFIFKGTVIQYCNIMIIMQRNS
jgi:hypothetical protein